MPNQKLNFLDALAARSGHRNEMFTGKFNTCLIKRQSAGMDPLTFAPSPLWCERQTRCLEVWKPSQDTRTRDIN